MLNKYSGTVKFDGAAPKQAKIDMSQDPGCKGTNEAENVVVTGGDLANVFVYVQGRVSSYGTKQRMKGFLEELPRAPGVKLNGYRVYGDWSPESVKPAVESWMQMGGKLSWIGAAGAQNDEMALALAELVKAQNVRIPVVGVDGLDRGKRAVDAGTLAATVVQPLGVAHAIGVFRDLLAGAAERDLIPDDGNIVLRPESYPSLERLAGGHGQPSPSLS